MTENEAKQKLENLHYKIMHTSFCNKVYGTEIVALCMAKDALEEIQQYRAIGTVARFEQLSKQFAPHNVDETSCHLRHCNKCDKYRKENEQYHAIGTVEEFKALKEKNEPKKVVYREQNYGTPWLCPECEASQIRVDFMHSDGSEPKEKHSYCWKCGTKIDWQ